MTNSKCNCSKNVSLGSYEGKDQTILHIPDHIDIKYNSPGAPKRDTVTIDTCLVDEILFLWSIGIKTTSCCCGHGIIQGSILVEYDDIPKMKDLGYKKWVNPMDNSRKDGFICKTRTKYD